MPCASPWKAVVAQGYIALLALDAQLSTAQLALLRAKEQFDMQKAALFRGGHRRNSNSASARRNTTPPSPRCRRWRRPAASRNARSRSCWAARHAR